MARAKVTNLDSQDRLTIDLPLGAELVDHGPGHVETQLTRKQNRGLRRLAATLGGMLPVSNAEAVRWLCDQIPLRNPLNNQTDDNDGN